MVPPRSHHLPPRVEELAVPPVGYPMLLNLPMHDVRMLMEMMSQEFGTRITFFERIHSSLKSADAIAQRTCKEMDGKFCDYLSNQFEKPVLLTGPTLTTPTNQIDNEKSWMSWLGAQEPGSVVYCAFGSQCFLDRDQFQEILLGLELTGYPFFAALKPPIGCVAIEEVLPDGFKEWVGGKGVVYGGWDIDQPIILDHRSVGCFVSHCGYGSMWESMMGKAQIVLVPQQLDQVINTRIMASEMKMAVEVEKDGGWVSRACLCKAVKEAMDKESDVGCLIRENHAKWREMLKSPGFMSGYVDNFVHQLETLLDCDGLVIS